MINKGFSAISKCLYNAAPRRLQYLYGRTKSALHRQINEPARIRMHEEANRIAENRLRGQACFRVVFLVQSSSLWKFAGLFRTMEKHPRFDPHLVLLPFNNMPVEEACRVYRDNLIEFRLAGYAPIEVLSANGCIRDALDDLQPHLIFYTTPYDSLLPPAYRLRERSACLSCYSRYGYALERKRHWYDMANYNLFWRFFLVSEEDLALYRHYSRCGGKNGFAAGPPVLDDLHAAAELCRPEHDLPPLVIIAPHHSIEPWGYSLSNFLRLANFFRSLPARYAGRLRFAFKPHPHLREKLNKHPRWGNSATDVYYRFWQESPGCLLCEGAYAELFAQSSAMLHDSSAFCVEYQLIRKPAAFIRRSKRIPQKLNTVASEAFALHCLVDTEADILAFLDRVAAGVAKRPDNDYDRLYAIAVPGDEKKVADRIVNHILSAFNQ